MIKRFNEFAELIGEGFLADRIVMSENRPKATEYAKEILKGRNIVRTDRMCNNALRCLKRYNRFLKWIRITYGNQKFRNSTEAKNFLNQKLKELLFCIGDWKLFFQWLREETLRDTSQMIFG